jgi:hypothetical protein
MLLGMTLQEIKDAIDDGKTVYWSNERYVVIKDPLRDGTFQYLIGCDHGSPRANYIGLVWADGVTVNGRPEQFFVGK